MWSYFVHDVKDRRSLDLNEDYFRKETFIFQLNTVSQAEITDIRGIYQKFDNIYTYKKFKSFYIRNFKLFYKLIFIFTKYVVKFMHF